MFGDRFFGRYFGNRYWDEGFLGGSPPDGAVGATVLLRTATACRD